MPTLELAEWPWLTEEGALSPMEPLRARRLPADSLDEALRDILPRRVDGLFALPGWLRLTKDRFLSPAKPLRVLRLIIENVDEVTCGGRFALSFTRCATPLSPLTPAEWSG